MRTRADVARETMSTLRQLVLLVQTLKVWFNPRRPWDLVLTVAAIARGNVPDDAFALL